VEKTTLRTYLVRGVDQEAWFALRAEAQRRGVRMGALLSRVVREWLAARASDLEEVA
jgi:esterase/lipase superfamily enzyme